VVRTSNAYEFRDPQPQRTSVSATNSENRGGTLNQDISKPLQAPAIDLTSPLERALARFGAVIATKNGIEDGTGAVPVS
jgi:hypothetical protein